MLRYLFQLILLLSGLNVLAHGDEDHGAAQHHQGPGKNYFTVNGVSNQFELVLRYEPLKAGQKMKMVLFVSDFETNKPVSDAKIEVTTIEGDLRFTAARIDSGVYNIEGAFPANKEYTLAANISAGGKADLITLDHVDVGRELPVVEEHADGEGDNFKAILITVIAFISGLIAAWLLLRARRRNPGSMGISLALLSLAIPLQPYQQAFAHGGEDHDHAGSRPAAAGKTDELEVLKETQFLLDIETAFAKQSSFNNVMKLYGRVTSTPEGEARIMAPQPGTIITVNVSVGQKVGKGQILAVVEQTLGAAEHVQLEAEKSTNLGELEQAKKDYDRLKSLEGIVAKKEIIEADIRYKTALQNQKVYSTIAGSGRVITIKSPIDGIVTNFTLSTGQVLEQGQQLFSVIDNSRLKIDAQVFGEDIKKITNDMRFTLDPMNGNSSMEAKLIAFGKIVDPVTQSTQLVLETDNPDAALMPGQYVTVNVVAKSAQQHLVIPSSALSEINGKHVVYIHTSPEIFTVRFVQAGESSNESTVILKGLKEGERVVVNGAYQVKSIYLNQ
jgi:membrane fusion protein, heavy metal efflux system